jgi:hypothetical protein
MVLQKSLTRTRCGPSWPVITEYHSCRERMFVYDGLLQVEGILESLPRRTCVPYRIMHNKMERRREMSIC